MTPDAKMRGYKNGRFSFSKAEKSGDSGDQETSIAAGARSSPQPDQAEYDSN